MAANSALDFIILRINLLGAVWLTLQETLFPNFPRKRTTPRKSLLSNISYNEDSAYSQGTPISSTDDSAIDIPQKRLFQSLIEHLPNTQFLRQQQQIFLDTENCNQ